MLQSASNGGPSRKSVIRLSKAKLRRRLTFDPPAPSGVNSHAPFKSLKGPSDKMMAELGYDVSALGVARLYRDICGTILIDDVDEGAMFAIDALPMRAIAAPSVMRTLEDKERLAREVLHAFARAVP